MLHVGTAYDPSEINGDDGLAGRLELQYSTNIPVVKGAAQVYGFYDVGVVRNHVLQPGEPRSTSLSSAGGGVRVNLYGRLSGYVELAQPATGDVQAQVLAREETRPARVFVGMTVRY